MSRMTSNSVTPKVSFRPRVTAAPISGGIIGPPLVLDFARLPGRNQNRSIGPFSDYDRVSVRRPVLSGSSRHLYLVLFLCVRLLAGRPVIVELRRVVDASSAIPPALPPSGHWDCQQK